MEIAARRVDTKTASLKTASAVHVIQRAVCKMGVWCKSVCKQKRLKTEDKVIGYNDTG